MKSIILCVATIAFVLALSSCSSADASSPDPTTILERIAGHWVDIALYDSPTISADLLWPLEMVFYPQGMATGVRPLSAFIIDGAAFYILINPLNMRDLGNGFVEMTVDTSRPSRCHPSVFHYYDPLSGHCFCQTPGRDEAYMANMYVYRIDGRIIVDTSGPTIDSLTIYKDEAAYTMVRFCGENNVARSRYYYEPLESGVRVRYFVGMWVFPRFFQEIWIYRSTEEGYRGERVITHARYGLDDSIYYEFVDTTAQHGQTYFYSIWPSSEWTGSEEPLLFGGNWQMVVMP